MSQTDPSMFCQSLFDFAVTPKANSKKASQEIARYRLFVDGAARGNPGPAGAGVYIKKAGEDAIKKSYYLGTHTNNSAEYLALALGLFLIKQEEMGKTRTVEILAHSDSQLLVRQMQGIYKVRKLHIGIIKSVIDKFIHEICPNLQITFKHIFREKNQIADDLANFGIDKQKQPPEEFTKIMLSCGIEMAPPDA